jgi:hypothetical protein
MELGFVDVKWMRGPAPDYDYVEVPGSGHRVVVEMHDLGVRENHHVYTEPAVGECECGAHVSLGRFTNTCERCNRDYNSAGQMLAPREQWGEETGESVSDILMADVNPFEE